MGNLRVVLVKPIIAGLILTALVMLVAHLEYRFAPTEVAMQQEAPRIFKFGYPCETWIKQSGGGEPIFSCVKATRE